MTIPELDDYDVGMARAKASPGPTDADAGIWRGKSIARVAESPDGMTVLSRATIAEGRTWTVPTLVGTTLFVRDRTMIRAFDLGVPTPSTAASLGGVSVVPIGLSLRR